MNVIKILPLILGGAIVVQARLNKTIAETIGLSTAGMINGVIVAICAVFIFVLSYYFPAYFPDIVPFQRNKGQSLQWWYLLPGIIGFSLVLAIPLVIMGMGTLPVFLGIIAGQIIVSIFWDAYYENIPVNSVRVAGAALTFIGALLVVWKK